MNENLLMLHQIKTVSKCALFQILGKVHKHMMGEFGMKEPDCPAQNPEVNFIKHFWDELEWRL